MQEPHAPPPPVPTPLAELIERALTRRAALQGLGAFVALEALGGCRVEADGPAAGEAAPSASSLTFAELPHGSAATHAVAAGYGVQVLLRWGDAVHADAPEWKAGRCDPAGQARQFGYNNDFIAFLAHGADPDAGLLCVNHEYTRLCLMLPGLTAQQAFERASAEHCRLEQEAHGHTIVAVRRAGGSWQVERAHALNRRISARTPCRISGPAAGHERLRTRADPEGRTVLGILNNCSGGVTPWRTVLTCEENFNWYFAGRTADGREARNHARYAVGAELVYPWARHEERFDVAREPREANRFGWVVEIDPFDPAAPPRKRTALGRIKHEAATCVVNHDGRVVVYMGDDDEFEFLYRFVSDAAWKPDDPAANAELLDHGTLYVARFTETELVWLPLVQGQGPLTAANGFAAQADVLIETRTAATLVGATPLDRPEDVETCPVSGKVYAVLTNNVLRSAEQEDAANPREKNRHGHILELVPPLAAAEAAGARDHAAARFAWEPFLLAGDPREKGVRARYGAGLGEHGWLSCPDNLAFDARGRMWITTDGLPKSGLCDGVWACDTSGPAAAVTRHFFRGPIGAELAGPCFSPDGSTLFLSVQHPGETDAADGAAGITFAQPGTRWPDFQDGVPPRPAVIAITRLDGGPFGS